MKKRSLAHKMFNGRKSNMVVKALAGLILAIIALSIAIKPLLWIMTSNSDSKDSFDIVREKIEDIYEDSRKTRDLDAVNIDKGTYVAGFAKESKEIELETSLFDANFHFLRPDECSMEKSCLCLCKEYDLNNLKHQVNYNEYKCEENSIYCYEYDFDFQKEMSGYEFYGDENIFSRADGYSVKPITKMTGGFILLKNLDQDYSVGRNILNLFYPVKDAVERQDLTMKSWQTVYINYDSSSDIMYVTINSKYQLPLYQSENNNAAVEN